MFKPRLLRRLTFPERIATYGVPIAWVVIFTQQSAPFLSTMLGFAIGVTYIVCVAWHGFFRQLYVHNNDARQTLDLRKKAKRVFVRLTNTIADASTAACFLYFMRGYEDLPTGFFAPLFFLALVTHITTEIAVQEQLNILHGHQTFNNRSVSKKEKQALISLEKVTVI